MPQKTYRLLVWRRRSWRTCCCMRRGGGHGLFRSLVRFPCCKLDSCCNDSHSMAARTAARTSHRLPNTRPIRGTAYLHCGYETRAQSGPPWIPLRLQTTRPYIRSKSEFLIFDMPSSTVRLNSQAFSAFYMFAVALSLQVSSLYSSHSEHSSLVNTSIVSRSKPSPLPTNTR